MTDQIQEISVYVLFFLAIGYFGVRFYMKNLRKKTVANKKNCGSDVCGCS